MDQGSSQEEGFFSPRSLQALQSGHKIALSFDAVFLVLCVGSYPNYHVLEFSSTVGNCVIASVAHHYFSLSICYIVGSSILDILSFLALFSLMGSDKKKQLKIWAIVSYLAISFGVFLKMMAISQLATFYGETAQPSLLEKHKPLDGYVCPVPDIKS